MYWQWNKACRRRRMRSFHRLIFGRAQRPNGSRSEVVERGLRRHTPLLTASVTSAEVALAHSLVISHIISCTDTTGLELSFRQSSEGFSEALVPCEASFSLPCCHHTQPENLHSYSNRSLRILRQDQSYCCTNLARSGQRIATHHVRSGRQTCTFTGQELY